MCFPLDYTTTNHSCTIRHQVFTGVCVHESELHDASLGWQYCAVNMESLTLHAPGLRVLNPYQLHGRFSLTDPLIRPPCGRATAKTESL